MNTLKITSIGKHAILVLLSVLTFIPFLLLISLSFKNLNQFNTQRWQVTFPFNYHNYVDAWSAISPFILNSFIISLVTVVGVLVFSSLSAYAFARMKFRFKEKIFFLIIALLMIPNILTLVPLFSIVIKLHLIDSWWGLWGPYIAQGQVFCIFVLRSFFASIPEEMFEAARLDGASEFKALYVIVLPLSKPIISTLGVLNILSTWNEYVWPLMVINKQSMKPITVGLMSFQHQFSTDWGPLFAGYVIASLPLIILFAFASKYFVEGLVSGSVKM